MSELDGQFCINITRVAAEGDPPSVGYQTMGIGFAAREYILIYMCTTMKSDRDEGKWKKLSHKRKCTGTTTNYTIHM